MSEEADRQLREEFGELDAALAAFDPTVSGADVCRWWCETGKPAIEKYMKKWWWSLIPKKAREIIEVLVEALDVICECQ